MRLIQKEIRTLVSMRDDELFESAKQLQVAYELVRYVHDNGKLPVVNFAAGGIATPADASLMMQLGAEGVICRLWYIQKRKSHKARFCNSKGSYQF